MRSSSCCFLSLRSSTLVLSLFGAIANTYSFLTLLSLWAFLRSDVESEWEGSDIWRIDAARAFGALVSVYLATGAVACTIGFIGALKRIPSHVRLFLHYNTADLFLGALATIFFAFASVRHTLRGAVCEELSRQPDILRGLSDTGLNLENCESWFERVVLAVVGVLAILFVVRLQFTLTISNYHTELINSAIYNPPHRIYLLPARSRSRSRPHKHSDSLVYAQVDYITVEDARSLHATEAFISHIRPMSPLSRQNEGSINLPMLPGEGLLDHLRDGEKELLSHIV